MTIPDPVVGDPIRASWGQAITDAVNSFLIPQVMMLGRNTNFSIGDSTDQPITFYNEGVIFSSGSLINNSGSGALQALADGVYEWAGTVVWDSVGGGATAHQRKVFVLKNGSHPAHENGATDIAWPSGAHSSGAFQSSGGRMSLDNGDEIKLACRQNSSLTIDVTSTLFSLVRIA